MLQPVFIVQAFIDAVNSHPERHIINAGRNQEGEMEKNFISIALRNTLDS